MNEIIYKGLKLSSQEGCKYFSVKEGDTCSLIEDKKTSTMTLTYMPGSTTKTVSNLLDIPLVGESQPMSSLGLARQFNTPIVSLNGLKLKKLTSDTHVINIIIVSDSESRVVQDYNYTTIVVSSEDAENQDFVNYIFYSGNLAYLQPVGPKPKCWKFRNFPKITIGNKNLTLESDSTTVYSLRRRYDDYVIRAIDYQDQFVLEIRRILSDYGLELVRINKETTLKTTSHVLYQFSQTPTKIHSPFYRDVDDRIISQKIPVDFTLRCTDMVMFFDFKNKYNNVDLLTNFCEFKTTDKYGDRWTAAIKWGSITEDFNHLYQSDDNSNFSYQCSFRCELFFYECFDDRYEFLQEIILNLESENDIISTEEVGDSGLNVRSC